MENQKDLWLLKGNKSYLSQQFIGENFEKYDDWQDVALFSSKEKTEEYVKKHTRNKPIKESFDTIKPFNGPLSEYSEVKIEHYQKSLEIDPE